MTISAVIVAAGKSTRMNEGNKIFSILNDKSVLSHTVETFLDMSVFEQIVVVVSKYDYEIALEHLKGFESSDILLVLGGLRRQDSVKKGLAALNETHLVAIHDVARPCVTSEIINKGIQVVELYGSAIPVVPISSIVKFVDEIGFIVNTPDRNGLVEAQTPQFFNFAMIWDVHENIDDLCTDDANMAELYGEKIMTFAGDPRNMKITFQSDLVLAENILKGYLKNNEI